MATFNGSGIDGNNVLVDPTGLSNVTATNAQGAIAELDAAVGGGGGGEDLAATLVLGNVTGGTNVVMTVGDEIQGAVGSAVVATGTITVNTAPMTAGAKIHFTDDSGFDSSTLSCTLGARTSGAGDFDGSLGTVAAIAADIVAAINDGANRFDRYTATDLGGGVLRVDAVTAGSVGNVLRFADLSGGELTLSPSGGALGSGENTQKPLVLAATSAGYGTGQGAAIQMDAGGDARGVGAVDFQVVRNNPWEVASGNRSLLGGRYNFNRQNGGLTWDNYNQIESGDNYVPSFFFGNRHVVDYAPYGHMIGGTRHYLYAGYGGANGIYGAGFGPSIMWGADFRVYNAGQPQGAYGAYFGSFHRFEDGVFCQTNFLSGFGHQMRSPGSYVGANGIIGNQHDIYDMQASLVVGEVNNIQRLYSGLVAGEACYIDSGSSGGAFGFDVAITNSGVWGFGHRDNGIGAHQGSVAVMADTTTNGTQGTMFLDTSDRFILRHDQAWGFSVQVVANQTGGAAGTVGDSAYWTFEGLIKRDGANNTTLVGISSAGATTPLFADAAASGWTVEINADDTNEALNLLVTGELNKTIRWTAYLRVAQVGQDFI